MTHFALSEQQPFRAMTKRADAVEIASRPERRLRRGRLRLCVGLASRDELVRVLEALDVLDGSHRAARSDAPGTAEDDVAKAMFVDMAERRLPHPGGFRVASIEED